MRPKPARERLAPGAGPVLEAERHLAGLRQDGDAGPRPPRHGPGHAPRGERGRLPDQDGGGPAFQGGADRGDPG